MSWRFISVPRGLAGPKLLSRSLAVGLLLVMLAAPWSAPGEIIPVGSIWRLSATAGVQTTNGNDGQEFDLTTNLVSVSFTSSAPVRGAKGGASASATISASQVPSMNGNQLVGITLAASAITTASGDPLNDGAGAHAGIEGSFSFKATVDSYVTLIASGTSRHADVSRINSLFQFRDEGTNFFFGELPTFAGTRKFSVAAGSINTLTIQVGESADLAEGDTGGTATAKVHLQFQPKSAVVLRALEVTQSIQDWNNSIPLIAGKRTFARAHLEAISPADVNRPASGHLHGTRAGATLAGSPLAQFTGGSVINPARLAADTVAVRNNPRPGLATLSSITFALPDSWTQGTVDLRFEPDGLALDAREPAESGGVASNGMVSVTFLTTARPSLVVCPIRLATGSQQTTAGPTPQVIAQIVEFTKNLYPVDDFNWRIGAPIIIDVTGDPVDEDRLSDAVKEAQAQDSSFAGFYMGVIMTNDLPPSLEVNGSAGISEFNQKSAWTASSPLDNFGHELGHLLGRPHAVDSAVGRNSLGMKEGYCGEVASPFAEDFPFIFDVPDVRDPSLHLRVPTIGPMNSGEDAKIFGFQWALGQYEPRSPQTWFELMGYCRPNWISSHTYIALRDKIQQSFGAVPAPLQRPAAIFSAAAPEVYRRVRGSINLSSNTVDWRPFQCLLTANPPPTVAGDYQMQFLDSFGTVLSEVSFAAALPNDFERSGVLNAPFTVTFPADPTIRGVAIRQNGVLLGSRTASPHVPVVRVLLPNGGETISGSEMEIRWSASDADNDLLFYTVQYSPDNGANWQTLAVDLRQTNLTVRTEDLPGSAEALIRVSVSEPV